MLHKHNKRVAKHICPSLCLPPYWSCIFFFIFCLKRIIIKISANGTSNFLNLKQIYFSFNKKFPLFLLFSSRATDCGDIGTHSGDSDDTPCVKGSQGAPHGDGAPHPNGIDSAPRADSIDSAPCAAGINGTPHSAGVDRVPRADGVKAAPHADSVNGAPHADGVDSAPRAAGVDGTAHADSIKAAPSCDGIDGTSPPYCKSIYSAPPPCCNGIDGAPPPALATIVAKALVATALRALPGRQDWALTVHRAMKRRIF